MIFDFLYQHDAVAAEQKYEQSAPKKMKYSIESNGERISKTATNILEKDKSEVVGRRIIDYSFNIGSSSKYPGDVHALGKGYFGLLLEAKDDNGSPEWMVVAIGSAANFHSILDNRWIEAFYTEKDDGTPFEPGKDAWVIRGFASKLIKDEFSSFIKGCKIVDVDLKPMSCSFTLEKNGQNHLLEILNTDPRLCPMPGPYMTKKKIEQIPVIPADGQIGTLIIFMEEHGKIYV